MPSASSASVITECPIRYRPPMPRALPTTTTWARSSSTPDEQEATEENSDRSRIMSASVGISISPRATAMPSAVQPLETSIECRVSSVKTSWPRRLASEMVSMVSSGVLVWT